MNNSTLEFSLVTLLLRLNFISYFIIKRQLSGV